MFLATPKRSGITKALLVVDSPDALVASSICLSFSRNICATSCVKGCITLSGSNFRISLLGAITGSSRLTLSGNVTLISGMSGIDLFFATFLMTVSLVSGSIMIGWTAG